MYCRRARGRQTAVQRRLLQTVLCPHCWHGFTPDETLWIASHPELRGDPLLSGDEFQRFLPSRFAPSGEAIDERGARCQRLACPRCHLPISPILLEEAVSIYSLVGQQSCGKSHLLAAAAWRMRQSFPTQFGLSFADADPLSNRLINEHEERLFLQNDPQALVHIEKTQLQGSTYDSVLFSPGEPTLLPRPFLFTIAPTRGHPNERNAAEARVVLCAYDNAGEHFLPGADTPTAPGTQHLARSRVILFVYDPTLDPRFREQLRSRPGDAPAKAPAVTGRQDVILGETAQRLRTYRSNAATARIDVPLIVVVSKSDVWGGLLQGHDLVSDPWEPSPTGRGPAIFDRQRVDAASDALRALIAKTAPEFVALAEDSFERVIFIGVSALGCAPQLDPASGLLKVRPADVRPRWVEVPFLYSLARWSRTLVRTRAADSEPTQVASGGGRGR